MLKRERKWKCLTFLGFFFADFALGKRENREIANSGRGMALT
jgi:hypothetical protein